MPAPCRPCDQKIVRITRREFEALNIAAHQGRRAKTDLNDALTTIQSLRAQLAAARSELAASKSRGAAASSPAPAGAVVLATEKAVER